jgi:hypothetical protein
MAMKEAGHATLPSKIFTEEMVGPKPNHFCSIATYILQC